MNKFTKASIALTTLGGALMMTAPAAFATTINGSQYQASNVGPISQSFGSTVGSTSADSYNNYTVDPYTSTATTTVNGLGSTTSSTNYGGGSSNVSATGYSNNSAGFQATQSSNDPINATAQTAVSLTNGPVTTWNNLINAGGGALSQSASSSTDQLNVTGHYSNTTTNPYWATSTQTTNGLNYSNDTSAGGISKVSADGYSSVGGTNSISQSANSAAGATQVNTFSGTLSGNTVATDVQQQFGSGKLNQNLGSSWGTVNADENYTSDVSNPTLSSNAYTLDANGSYVTQQTSSSSGGSSYIHSGDDYSNQYSSLTGSQSAVFGANGLQQQIVGASLGSVSPVAYEPSLGSANAVTASTTGAGAVFVQDQSSTKSAPTKSAAQQTASASAGNTTAEYMKYGGKNGTFSQSYTTPVGQTTDSSSGGSTDASVSNLKSNVNAGFTGNQTFSGNGNQDERGSASNSAQNASLFWNYRY